jgi:hypothetical protein
MKYALLIYTNADDPALAPEEQEALTAEYMAFREDPRCLGGGHLQPIETTTTVRGGAGGEPLVIDGPYADTKEVFGGYFVFEAADLDEVLEVAQRIPAVRLGGAVEVRPLFEVPAEVGH